MVELLCSFIKIFLSLYRDIFDVIFILSFSFILFLGYVSAIKIKSLPGLYIEYPKIFLIFLAIRIILHSSAFHFLSNVSIKFSLVLLTHSILYSKEQPSLE